jgi:hypothetical protein
LVSLRIFNQNIAPLSHGYCMSHPFLLFYKITVKIICGEYRLWTFFVTYSFLHSPITSFLVFSTFLTNVSFVNIVDIIVEHCFCFMLGLWYHPWKLLVQRCTCL